MRPKTDGVYRIVHIDNLPDILERGMFAANHPDKPGNYHFIGHPRLTQQREEYPVPLPDAGNLGDYVPFYFGRLSIMLYNIHTGHGVQRVPREEIIYLLCTLDSLDAAGCTYCFTDGHAKSSQTQFFRQRADLDKVDWTVVNERYWQNTEQDRDIQRRKQAELLVFQHVPPKCIEHIVTYGEDAREKVLTCLENLNLSIGVTSKMDGTFYY
jgi:hypothetical protein